MQTTKTLKNRFRTVAKVENRQVCPACPVTLERAVFVYDYELGNKLIQFVLRNTGDRPVTGAVVRFRCYDGAGNCLYPGATPDSGITYSSLMCRPGEYFADSRAVKLWSYDIVNYEAWVTQVSYADGTSEDFSPEQYIARPPRALLCDLLSYREEKALLGVWGKRARCVPIAIDSTVWMCSCGRVSSGEVCRDCGAKKTAREPYFGNDATLAYARACARRRGALKAAVWLAALLGVAAALGAGVYYLTEQVYPAATREVTDLFLAEERYDEALAFARKRKDSVAEERVLTAAIDASLAVCRYEDALIYDSIRETPEPERIYRAAANDAISAMAAQTVDFTAAGYGLLTTDEALYDKLIHGLIDYCEENQLYAQAARYTRMLHDMGEEALGGVFDDAIADSMARGSYEEAFLFAEQHPDVGRADEVFAEIFAIYFDAGQYEDALAFTLRYSPDPAVFLPRILEKVDERFVAEHITDLYFAMNEATMRAWNAKPLALCKQAAYIDAEGIVKGLKDVAWKNAVSLSMNEFHTLCLFDDGTVSAAGNTAYGRCSVSSWTGVVDIAAGERHSAALRANGKVSAVGDNSAGQCDVTGWSSIISIAAGKYHTVALRADGRVLSTGSNASGQCNTDGYTDVIAIAAGDWTTVLLHRNGDVTVLGNTALGADAANEWHDIKAVSARSGQVLGLTADGRVLLAGRPTTGDGGSVEGLTNIKAIAAGSVCIGALREDGSLYLSGDGVPALH